MAKAEPILLELAARLDDRVAGRTITSGPPPAQAGGILTIDLSAIADNWLALGRRAMPSEGAAVIKADGYGCGMERVAVAATWRLVMGVEIFMLTLEEFLGRPA